MLWIRTPGSFLGRSRGKRSCRPLRVLEFPSRWRPGFPCRGRWQIDEDFAFSAFGTGTRRVELALFGVYLCHEVVCTDHLDCIDQTVLVCAKRQPFQLNIEGNAAVLLLMAAHCSCKNITVKWKSMGKKKKLLYLSMFSIFG